MAHHFRYWSNSRLADLIRGTKSLSGGSASEWNSWENLAKKSHPVRYWLAESGLDVLQDFFTIIPRFFKSCNIYINNRFFTRTHALTASSSQIKRGSWQEYGDRILPCLFDQLVEFVEVDLAWSHSAWSDDDSMPNRYGRPNGIFKLISRFNWRSRQAGLDYLNWASSLKYSADMGLTDETLVGKPTGQAEGAIAILALYHWWTVVRPARPDPADVSGWQALCDSMPDDILFLLESESDEDRLKSRACRAVMQKVEATYFAEDTEMLIKLVSIRQSLWT